MHGKVMKSMKMKLETSTIQMRVKTVTASPTNLVIFDNKLKYCKPKGENVLVSAGAGFLSGIKP
jgi:hypothetical protein